MKELIITLITTILISNTGSSQKTLIPYRDGNRWGMCDLSGKIVLNPVYDSIETIDYETMFRTYRNGKQGALYNGKEVIRPTCNSIDGKDKRFFVDYYSVDNMPTLGYSRNIIYNLKGEKVLNVPVRKVELIPLQLKKGDVVYYTYGVNDDSQVFIYDDRAQKIKQVLLKDQKGYLEADYSTERNEIYIYSYSRSGNSQVIIRYDDELKKYKVVRSTEKVSDPELTLDMGISGDFYKVKNNYSIKTVEFLKENGAIKLILRNSKSREVKNSVDTILLPLSGEEIKINKYIQDGGHELYEYNTSPNNETDKEKIDTLYIYRNYLVIAKNGKTGFMAENKLIEPQFESIKYFRAASDYKPYFLVCKLDNDSTMKYGVIRSDGRVIIPVMYDEIDFNSKGGYGKLFILKKEGRYGIALNDGTIIKEPQYDLITPNGLYFSLNIINNGKYGFYDINSNFCEPMFPYMVYFVSTLNNTKILKLADEKGKFVGYANFDGTMYFKN